MLPAEKAGIGLGPKVLELYEMSENNTTEDELNRLCIKILGNLKNSFFDTNTEDVPSLMKLKEKVTAQIKKENPQVIADHFGKFFNFVIYEAQNKNVKTFFELPDDRKVDYLRMLLKDPNFEKGMFLGWLGENGYKAIPDTKTRYVIFKCTLEEGLINGEAQILEHFGRIKPIDQQLVFDLLDILAKLYPEFTVQQLLMNPVSLGIPDQADQKRVIQLAMICAKKDPIATFSKTFFWDTYGSAEDMLPVIVAGIERNMEIVQHLGKWVGLWKALARGVHLGRELQEVMKAFVPLDDQTLSGRNQLIINQLNGVVAQLKADISSFKEKSFKTQSLIANLPDISSRAIEEIGLTTSAIGQSVNRVLEKYGSTLVFEDIVLNPDPLKLIRENLAVNQRHEEGHFQRLIGEIDPLGRIYMHLKTLESLGPVEIPKEKISTQHPESQSNVQNVLDFVTSYSSIRETIGKQYQDTVNAEGLLKEIQKIEDPFIKHHLLTWLTATILYFELNNVRDTWIADNHLLEPLVSFGIPTLRFPLTKDVFDLSKSSKGKALFDELKLVPQQVHQREKRKKDIPETHIYLPALLAALYGTTITKDPSVNQEDLKQAIKQFLIVVEQNGYQVFRDGKKFASLLRMLHALKESPHLSGMDKINILNNLSKVGEQKESGRKLSSEVESLLILFNFEADLELKQKYSSYESVVKKVFSEKVPLGKIDDFANKFAKVFSMSRKPDAIQIYTGSVAKTGDQKALQFLGEMITSICNEDFTERRYRTDKEYNPHLHSINAKYPDFLPKWKKALPPMSVTITPDDKQQVSTKEWLDRKLLVDKHLDLSSFDYLTQYCSDQTKRDQILLEIEKTIEQADPKIDQISIRKLEFEANCLRLTKAITREEQLKLLKLILDYTEQGIVANSEFHNDVKGLITVLTARVENDVFQVVDTDDPIDFLLCGTEVPGSCQRLDALYTNLGLLGYMSNGRDRLLGVKDKHGRFIARCLIRTFDDGDRQRVFMERVYPDGISQKLVKALKNMAIEKGKSCQTSVMVQKAENSSDHAALFTKSLFSLAGPSPWDYADSGEGLTKNGIIKIDKSVILYDAGDITGQSP